MTSIGNYANVLRRKLAVAEARKSDDELKLAHAVRHLGDAYYYAGQFAEAEPHYVEALAIYRGRPDRRPLDFANAVRSFAVLKAEVGATDEAKRLWQEAHDLYIAVDVPAGIAGSAANLALLAHDEGDTQQSRAWLDKAIRESERADDPEILEHIAEIQGKLER